MNLRILTSVFTLMLGVLSGSPGYYGSDVSEELPIDLETRSSQIGASLVFGDADVFGTAYATFPPPCNDPNILPIWPFIVKELGNKRYLKDCSNLVEVMYFNLDNNGPAEILVKGSDTPFWFNRGRTKFWIFKKRKRRYENVLSGFTDTQFELGREILTNKTNGHYEVLLICELSAERFYFVHLIFRNGHYRIKKEWDEGLDHHGRWRLFTTDTDSYYRPK